MMSETRHNQYGSIRILDLPGLEEAVRLLQSDQLVVIPTETVYGLGANALSKAAVEKIFQVKHRPMDNPLIVHLRSDSDLERYCEDISPQVYDLTKRFWPGPLTIVLKRRAIIPNFVTAGLDTVAVRCPDSPLTQMLLERLEFPIAAPSANLSGRPSTTTVAHVVEDLSGKVPAVLDGGDCTVGVESTILDMSLERPVLLRPGGVTLEELESVLGEILVDPSLTRPLGKGEQPKAPGMKYRHYAPKAEVVVVRGDAFKTADYIRTVLGETIGVLCFEEYLSFFPECPAAFSMGSEHSVREQAQLLFDRLREFDHHPEITRVYAQSPVSEGLGLAVTNRLNKAAGFRFVDV